MASEWGQLEVPGAFKHVEAVTGLPLFNSFVWCSYEVRQETTTLNLALSWAHLTCQYLQK